MTYVEMPELVDDLESWEDLERLLRSDGEAVECDDPRLVLEVFFHGWRGGELGLYAPGPLRAQDRRRLHRLGLRQTADGSPFWTWQAPVPDLARLEAETGNVLLARLRASGDVQRALLAVSIGVLRDALRLPVSDLVVRLEPEEDPFDEDDD